MEPEAFGRTLLIANPVAQSGAGRKGAQVATDALADGILPCVEWESVLTGGPGDAIRIAGASGDFDTIIALGGDGVIHEVANGLMTLPAPARPRLAVVPMGSGNDFARTLGMAANDPIRAIMQLAASEPATYDVGCVNGTYFVQTLSFGMDAAIALDTVTRRRKTGAHGNRLFIASALDAVLHQRKARPYHAWSWPSPGSEPVELEGDSLIWAVQVGPTYGSGFIICPDADPTDGLLDVCRNVRTPGLVGTLALLARAKTGAHVTSPAIDIHRASRIQVTFPPDTPCQADGEKVTGTTFDITCVPAALPVWVPCDRH